MAISANATAIKMTDVSKEPTEEGSIVEYVCEANYLCDTDPVTDFHLRSSWVRIKVSSKVMLGFEIKVDLCLRFLFYMLVYVQRVKTSKRFGN